MRYPDRRITPIDDVTAEASYRGSGRTWHTPIYIGQWSSGKKKNAPFNPPDQFGVLDLAVASLKGWFKSFK